jgi:hypothetical protein
MAKRLCLLVLVIAAGAQLPAQQFPPGFVDPGPVLAAASKAINEQSLRCITFSGTGYSGPVGQTFENAVNIDWPRSEMANYTRTINWESGTSKETFDRKPGNNPRRGNTASAGSAARRRRRTCARRTSSTARTRGTSTAAARPSRRRPRWPMSISSTSG